MRFLRIALICSPRLSVTGRNEIKSENGENWSVKQMVIFRKNLDERLKKLSAEEKKDDLLTFEQLGVDMMMVDEAHFFKNCFVFTKLRNVAGITTSRNVLLAKGVPESEIAFVHDATSEAQRQELFERTRQGKVRILIGSTSKLGTGVNVQNKVISIDHLDCPWKPSDITQRNGRGVRQGNENPEIMIKQFVAKGTFDAYLWQIQEQKLRYITQILTGKHIARSCEDVDETVLSAAQFKAAATDNPMVAQKMELENRVTELKILRGAWSNEQLSLERKISTIYPGQIKRYEKEIDQIGEDIKLLNQSAGSDFSIVLDGKRYTERSEAGEAFGLLYRMIKEGAKDDSEEFEIGAYRSFPLYLSVGYVSRLVLRYNHHYTTEVGTSALGAITRIEHLAERIPGYLKEAQRELEDVQKQLAVAQQQVGQPFIYEDELSEKVAQLTEINTKLEFESLQESEVILDENGQRSDGEEDWDSERVPSCASAEVCPP